MTTLRVAPNRHHHTENLSGKRRRYLPKRASREEGGLGAVNNYNYCTQKQHEQNDWLLQQRCKITKALLNPKSTPHAITDGDRWPAFSCVYPPLNLATFSYRILLWILDCGTYNMVSLTCNQNLVVIDWSSLLHTYKFWSLFSVIRSIFVFLNKFLSWIMCFNL